MLFCESMARKNEVANIMMLKMIDLVSNLHKVSKAASEGKNFSMMSLEKSATI